MPLPDRVLDAATGPGDGADPRLRERALAVLTAPDLAHVVDLVAYADDDVIHVVNADGEVVFDRAAPYTRRSLTGRDPIAAQDPLAFSTLADEPVAPTNEHNVYPLAAERLAGLFDHPAAPDLAVVHTAGHFWAERGGHLGEHGSLDVVQSRAPLVLSGAGVSHRGVLDRWARTVDVGPTLAHALGVPAREDGTHHAEQTGRALADLVSPGAAYVVGLLWDGCNSSDLYALAADGELPNVARLLDGGCALRGGAIAEFPSVTLVNHTSAITGTGPGRHGILNNAYYDRRRGEQVVANESATWHRASEWLEPAVETVFEVVARAMPGTPTACVNEPVDRGASYSTFGLVRDHGHSDGAKSLTSSLPDPTADQLATQEYVAADSGYSWGSSVDATGIAQVLGLWEDAATRPRLMWWNTTLTDSAHHAGGPHSAIARASMRDADRRLGLFLDLLDDARLTDDTFILLTSDHGSEAADPTCRGDWDEALRAAGIPFRDEAYGFIYLG
ncbi:MAG TPA: alkaline phosphatase family protein [Mycobacteriales bacterium]|nr:alkaline phosphatase family protein [Mycobacteriales bacterium]